MGSKLDAMKQAAAEGTGSSTGQRRKDGRPRLKTPLISCGQTKPGGVNTTTPAEEKGRWPDGTRIECRYWVFIWTVHVYVSWPSKKPEAIYDGWECVKTGASIHPLLDTVFAEWVKAGKPGA